MTTTIGGLPGSFLLDRSAKTLSSSFISVLSSSPSDDLRTEIDDNQRGFYPITNDRVGLLSLPEFLCRLWFGSSLILEFRVLHVVLLQMKPSALLGDVISTVIRTATSDQTLEEIDHHFKAISGLPVIDENLSYDFQQNVTNIKIDRSVATVDVEVEVGKAVTNRSRRSSDGSERRQEPVASGEVEEEAYRRVTPPLVSIVVGEAGNVDGSINGEDPSAIESGDDRGGSACVE
ncbi:hypothetical protein KSP40_PGU005675 [Platanthera guangdongensis]|uniref:Uncharacterized protein n=1 Tax=Platanthera guangdongensis TaxID=2320717 RepID=A0ABR2M4I0_9ASPA